jgi:hypothetical protein
MIVGKKKMQSQLENHSRFGFYAGLRLAGEALESAPTTPSTVGVLIQFAGGLGLVKSSCYAKEAILEVSKGFLILERRHYSTSIKVVTLHYTQDHLAFADYYC